MEPLTAEEVPEVEVTELDDLVEFCRVHERRNAEIAAEIKVEMGEPGRLSRECFEARALGFRRLRDALMQSRAALLAARADAGRMQSALREIADSYDESKPAIAWCTDRDGLANCARIAQKALND